MHESCSGHLSLSLHVCELNLMLCLALKYQRLQRVNFITILELYLALTASLQFKHLSFLL